MFKSKKELAIALMEGRKFKTKMGCLLYYNEKIFANPFRYKDPADKLSDTMIESWNIFSEVAEVKEWYDDIPIQGILCWVWNNCHEYDKAIRLVVGIKTKSGITIFRTNPSVYWDRAMPLTKEEMFERTYTGDE